MKKILIIVALILVVGLGAAGFLVQAGYLDLNAILGKGQQEIVKPQTVEVKPEEKIPTAEWKDPAGFSFSYNKDFKVNNHPEDEVNYANLELTVEGPAFAEATAGKKEGKITVLVSDSQYATLEDWLKKDPSLTNGSALETTVAGMKAKKIAVGGKIFTGFLDSEKIFYLLVLNPKGDESFWRKNYEVILNSFKFTPYEGEEAGSARLEEAAPAAEEDGGNVVYEEEEIVE